MSFYDLVSSNSCKAVSFYPRDDISVPDRVRWTIQDAYGSIPQLDNWGTEDELLQLPDIIPEEVKKYWNLLRDFQEQPLILSDWYLQLTSGRIPDEIAKIVSSSIEMTFATPDATTIELSSMLATDSLSLPKEIHMAKNGKGTYLDLIWEMDTVYDNTVCRNVVTRADGRIISWPFFIGIPTEQFSSLGALNIQSMLGIHPLATLSQKTSDYSYDGHSKRDAIAALNHDEDHLSEQGHNLMRRAFHTVAHIGLDEDIKLHRNILIPAALVDILFKRLVLQSIDDQRKELTPLQDRVVDAFLFGHHEDQSRFLPRTLVHHFATSAVDSNKRQINFTEFVSRWKNEHDMKAHFEDFPKPIDITWSDCLVALNVLNSALDNSLKLIESKRDLNGTNFSPKICALLDTLVPAYKSALLQYESPDQWLKDICEYIECNKTSFSEQSSEIMITID